MVDTQLRKLRQAKAYVDLAYKEGRKTVVNGYRDYVGMSKAIPGSYYILLLVVENLPFRPFGVWLPSNPLGIPSWPGEKHIENLKKNN